MSLRHSSSFVAFVVVDDSPESQKRAVAQSFKNVQNKFLCQTKMTSNLLRSTLPAKSFSESLENFARKNDLIFDYILMRHLTCYYNCSLLHRSALLSWHTLGSTDVYKLNTVTSFVLCLSTQCRDNSWEGVPHHVPIIWSRIFYFRMSRVERTKVVF